MPRVHVTTVHIRKTRPRPSGVSHRLRSALLRAAVAFFRGLCVASCAVKSLAARTCQRLSAADDVRRWRCELHEELERAYASLVREPSPFLTEHRGRWMVLSHAGDVLVYESLQEAADDEVEGLLHCVGDPLKRQSECVLIG